MSRELRISSAVDLGSIQGLIGGTLDLVWARGYRAASTFVPRMPDIVRACAASTYTLSGDLQCVGISAGEAAESTDAMERYLAAAPEVSSHIRDVLFAGGMSPIDALRLALDELWPAGANVARHGTRQLLPNVIRRWTAGGHANPHIDQKSIPLLEKSGIAKRLGVNFYLDVPPAGGGGQLEFWDVLVDDEPGYMRRKRHDYGLDRNLVGPPDWQVSPARGDLLMFDAARLHAVREITAGERITMACFVGVRNEAEPLCVFA